MTKDSFYIKTCLPSGKIELNQKVVTSSNLLEIDYRLFSSMEGRIVRIINKPLKNVIVEFVPEKFYSGKETSCFPFFTPRCFIKP